MVILIFVKMGLLHFARENFKLLRRLRRRRWLDANCVDFMGSVFRYSWSHEFYILVETVGRMSVDGYMMHSAFSCAGFACCRVRLAVQASSSAGPFGPRRRLLGAFHGGQGVFASRLHFGRQPQFFVVAGKVPSAGAAGLPCEMRLCLVRSLG